MKYEYSISKEFHFSAGHILRGLPDSHPCSRQHGHNYKIVLFLGADKLNETGFVVDYRSLSLVKIIIDEHYDHRNLNDVVSFNPTAENLARHFYELFYDIIPQLYRVDVSETPKTNCSYEPKI